MVKRAGKRERERERERERDLPLIKREYRSDGTWNPLFCQKKYNINIYLDFCHLVPVGQKESIMFELTWVFFVFYFTIFR